MKKIIYIITSLAIIFSIGVVSVAKKDTVPKIQDYSNIKQYFRVEIRQAVTMEYDIIYVDNNREKIILTTSFSNDVRCNPVIKLNENEVLLAYGYIYNIQQDSLNKLNIPINIFYADVNVSKNLLAYVGKNNDGKFEIGYFDLLTNRNYSVKIIETSDWGETLNAELFVDWGKDNEFYFDVPQNGIPTIMKYNLNKQNIETIKKNAIIPAVSNNGEVFSYISTDVYAGYGKIKRETYIENFKTKDVYKVKSEKIIYYDENNNIYMLGDGILEVLDSTTFSIKEKKKINKNILFPELVNGKLQYYKAKVVNNEIVSFETFITN